MAMASVTPMAYTAIDFGSKISGTVCISNPLVDAATHAHDHPIQFHIEIYET
jgi:hypothetical protein